ncbi:hypothetical protein C1X34_20045 [Pseudomonas sp. GW456-12-10-14-TSB6]|nr:hypothetical protein C1X55_17645 [Pseudomonas sp. GW460-C8]PMW17175.1 hypothetical protein C1X40_17665 [Pseudomonas sp. GW456-11-11-14-TSB2]PMW21084.1 hypothetical protein C1X53_16785 [Pseudomonas sp. GW456-E6]PMW33584.1 hypothetical protein C1X48_22165 [Pseudomonas sp. FW305-3-2-15-A-R2A1]PMW36567.1 hypothetical protein C1X45_15035 [Pseudomonas sp. GW460-7]PMW57483.1 hypothetical protein C1X39_20205 [Pseudomonas sp. GW456-12-1-14-TSB1]PMW66538.1 hypothetical protein C1X31_07025 [Pseudomon
MGVFVTFILSRCCGVLMSMGAVFLALMVAYFSYLSSFIRIMMSSGGPFLTLMQTFMVMHFALAATVLMTTTVRG